MKQNFITDIIDLDIKEKTYSREIYTRFPPEPNGFLHIGHAKAIYISFEIAKKYNAKCNLRFDDTNPIKENDEFASMILKDVKWLGYEPHRVCYASDYFEKFYDYALLLIEKGLAYVDDDNSETIKNNRGTLTEPGTESPYRNRTVSENLEFFKKMRDGVFENGEKVLRAKIDMSSPNLNMRDPVLYRILKEKHHRTGYEWSIYPMYDFAHPIEDAIEKVTHSLCSLEFENHRPLYDWVLSNIDIVEPPKQIEFARLNITNTVLSKRSLLELILDKKVDSWEDVRMPTLSGMRRRGIPKEAILKFCEEIGVAKSNSIVDISLFEHIIREELKLKVKNKFVCFNPIKVVLTNYGGDKSEMIELENNKENPDLGTREVSFSNELYIDGEDFMLDPPKKYFRLFVGNEVRLSGAYFIKCNEVIKDENGNVKELHCTYDPKTKSGLGFTERKVKGTIHWVDAKTAVQINVNEISYLFNEDNTFNENSKVTSVAFAESSIKDSTYGESFQFFRKGYYNFDVFSDGSEKVFNSIVPLKSSFKK